MRSRKQIRDKIQKERIFEKFGAKFIPHESGGFTIADDNHPPKRGKPVGIYFAGTGEILRFNDDQN